MKFHIVSRRKIWFLISALIILPGLFSMVTQGFNLGIDFTGGTLIDLKFARPVTVAQVREALQSVQLESSTIQLAAETQQQAAPNVLIRTHVLNEEERRGALNVLQNKLGAFEVSRIEKVGAVIGDELTRQALYAVVAASIMMVLYITYRFEFRFAVSGILALLHDVAVVLGMFSILQKEIDASFIAAILTIIGYSINDTIVVFDRIRENLKTRRKEEHIDDMVDRSIWQTMTRSIYTVLTVLFVTLALYLFGGETTKNFSLALLIGISIGAYSSIFIASPIWVTWREYADNQRLHARTKGSK